jgi:hypothetical protein
MRTLYSLLLITLIFFSAFLIGNFFNIETYIYMPIILWLVALAIFNIFLEPEHENVYVSYMNKYIRREK